MPLKRDKTRVEGKTALPDELSDELGEPGCLEFGLARSLFEEPFDNVNDHVGPIIFLVEDGLVGDDVRKEQKLVLALKGNQRRVRKL